MLIIAVKYLSNIIIYFSESLTGYKETNKANQKWGFVYGDEE